jgi:hypothetical protein
MIIAIAVSVGLAIMLGVFVIELRRTPEGFEDDAGFHLGDAAASSDERPKPARRGDAAVARRRERKLAKLGAKV